MFVVRAASMNDMSDVLFDLVEYLLPGIKPQPATERLWSLARDGHQYVCALRYRGTWGVEAQVFCDGTLIVGRLFETRMRAVEWAGQEQGAES